MVTKMDERRKIEDKLRKKEQELHAYEDRAKAARIYIQALQDVLKMLPKGRDEAVSAQAVLRPGGAVASARQVILSRGEPVHISDLMSALDKEPNRENRASLTSSLSAYVRRGEIFTRPAPNTFGLIELGHNSLVDGDDGPPAGFGSIEYGVESPPASPAEDDEDIPF
jgi:hypothetical protein